MEQRKKWIFWTGFMRICVRAFFCPSISYQSPIKMCNAHFNCADCQKTTVLSLRDPEGVVAISQNHLASCMYSGKYETFLLDCTRRGYAASVTLVPRERLRYHVASLLAMTCRGLFRHAAAGTCPRPTGGCFEIFAEKGSVSFAAPSPFSPPVITWNERRAHN